ncbi:hypothetical protein ABK040_008573 [Willaertia magna]
MLKKCAKFLKVNNNKAYSSLQLLSNSSHYQFIKAASSSSSTISKAFFSTSLSTTSSNKKVKNTEPKTSSQQEKEQQHSISSDSEYYEKRKQELNEYKLKYPNLLPSYPNWKSTCNLKEFREKYDNLLSNGEKLIENEEFISGRIISKRTSSSKLHFYTIRSTNDHQLYTLQIMSSKDYYENNNLKEQESLKEEDNSVTPFQVMNHLLRKGDFVGIRGFPAKTKNGELSIISKELKLLSSCYYPLPQKISFSEGQSLEDLEKRYRHRHLDLLSNHEELYQTFLIRNKTLSFIRNFFNEKGFLEVETPILSSKSGGANAKPFETHLNAMDLDLKLRIAPELYLKQLVIGGIERVFELGKVFRNEGIDHTHNPEFTSCEAYQAFADYKEMMNLTEEFFRRLVLEVKGSTIIQLDGVGEIDFGKPFKRISYINAIEEAIGEKVPLANEEGAIDKLLALCKKHEIKLVPSKITYGYLLDKLLGTFVEPQCKEPTFIMDHPVELSPLSKSHPNPSSHHLTERFELFIGGKELCNAYSELNDPDEQRDRFRKQQEKKDKDDEAHEMDEAFCKSLEYGLPPTGGWGIGVDRLVMLLTNQKSIRDVLLFPMTKPKKEE